MLIDISISINENMAFFKGDPKFELKSHLSIEKGDNCNVSKISLSSHTGTHVDAPYHFIKDSLKIDEVDLNKFCGTAKVIEVLGKSNVEVDDIKDIPINEEDIILFKTDNSFKSYHDLSNSYCAVSYEAAKYLAAKKIKLIGIDCLTIEPENSLNFEVHKTILGNGIVALEGLNLKDIDQGSYILYCFPLKLQGCDGSPVRAVLKTL